MGSFPEMYDDSKLALILQQIRLIFSSYRAHFPPVLSLLKAEKQKQVPGRIECEHKLAKIRQNIKTAIKIYASNAR